MNYIDAPLKKYIEDASSGRSTPGGGSVSALVGALGTTMASMSSNFTIGREKFKDVEPVVREILDKCDKGREELLNLMEEDIKSYGDVTAAYGLPKSTESEKKKRLEDIQNALKNAMDVPLKIVNCCLEVLENIRRLADVANPNLISDVGVAALFTNAALLGGKLNVDINLAYIKDETLAQKAGKEIKESETRAQTLLNETMKIVKSKIEK